MEKRKKPIKIALIVIIIIPLIMLIGVEIGDRNYWLVSVVLVILAMVPFFSLFEKRKPRSREIVPIATMAAIAAVGRVAFAMVPQFKPVAAIVIITGMSFGPEAGFLTGAISALVSNFFFGQGPWTPWQMFAFGIVGFLAGILYKKNIIRSKLSICVFGGISGYLYGIIVNCWTVFSVVKVMTVKSVLAIYVGSIPFDTIHAVSTVIFLYILAMPMKEKMERLRRKYGLFR